MKRYSLNPQVNAVIHELLAHGFAPIPVAPKPGAFSKANPDKFTGKNPSFLRWDGSYEILNHGKYQNKLPSVAELKRWFVNPDTGIGTLCGYDDTVWLDFDSKNFESQKECDLQVNDFIVRNNLASHWIEQTGSGGWRVPVKTLEKPSFTNFALEPGGVHIGEALGRGRFTVLAPSIHPKTGKPYRRISTGSIPEVESLYRIGIYPAALVNVKPSVDWAALKAHRVERRVNKVGEDLVDFLEFEVLPRLTAEQIFNWDGHNFKQIGKTLKGVPPWRSSASGTSFHVWCDGSHWAWQDKATGVGGGAVQYRWQLRGNTGTPKGKDFVDIVAELATDAGVPMPDLPKQTTNRDYNNRDVEQERFEEYCDRHSEQQQEESLKSFFTNRLEKLRKYLARTNKTKRFQNNQQCDKERIRKNDDCKSESTRDSNNPRDTRTVLTANSRSDIKRFARLLALRYSAKPSSKNSKGFWSCGTSRRRGDDNSIHNSATDSDWGSILFFEEGSHSETIQRLGKQAQEAGKKLIILDNSPGGSGKSQLAGELTPQGLGVNTIFYTSPTHRNPTVASIEQNYLDLPVRHNGLVADDTLKTPLGNPHVRWPRKGEQSNLPGTCSKTNLFHAFAAKGYQTETTAEASENPICRVCEWKNNCAGANGLPTIPNHTFRQERRNALAHDRIRCALDSLPDIRKMQKADSEKEEALRVAVIVDESTQFKSYNETQADLQDFDTAWMYLQSQVHKSWSLIAELSAEKDQFRKEIDQKQGAKALLESQIAAINIQCGLPLGGFNTADPNLKSIQELEAEVLILTGQLEELLEQENEIINQIDEVQDWTAVLPEALATLEPIIFVLRLFLNGEENITSQTRFGWTEAMIRAKLGNLLDDPVKEALEVVRKFSPKLENLLKRVDTVTQDGMSAEDRKGSAATLKLARKVMQGEADKKNQDAIANMPSNCIVPVLDILLNQQNGSFRIAYQTLTIYTRNDRHRNQLKQADFTLVLDGTETRESLAKKLECNPSEIVVIQQKPKSYKNLKIIQITGMGLLGASRSKTAKQRVAAVAAAIKEQHGCDNTGVIDHKKALDLEEEAEAGYWFHHNRGSNRFKEKTALLSVGTPFQNIGHLQMLFTTMTGDLNPERGNWAFDKFVQAHVQNEMRQTGWRLRSTRRPDEQLYWYIASDGDLSYLRAYFPDAEFSVKAASDITLDAAGIGEKTKWAILEAYKILTEAKKKITQSALAKIVGCDRSRISQIANELCEGGFPSFKKVLAHLLSTLYRGTNTFDEPLTEEEQFAAMTYLPLVVEENASDPISFVKEVVSVAESFGLKSFTRVLTALDPHHRAKILGNMLAFLPQEWLQEFLEIAQC